MPRLLSCLSIPAIILVAIAIAVLFTSLIQNGVETPVPDPTPTPDTGATDLVDRDGDGLFDIWEEEGLDVDNDKLIDLNLAILGADPDRRDVFVELDYMSGFAPSPEAILRVKKAFSDNGIELHLFVDEEVPYEKEIDLDHTPSEEEFTSFDKIKLGKRDKSCDGYFGAQNDRQHSNCAAVLDARKKVFRYGLFADHLSPRNGRSGGTGRAEVGGNDFIVTLGGLESDDAGNFVFEVEVSDSDRLEKRILFSVVDGQAGTLMHELGHTLGLWHGGNDKANCKPNYLSVMSYTRQFPFLPTEWLDYSGQRLPSLDEDRMDEPAGIGRVAGQFTVFGYHARAASAETDEGIDWDRNQTSDSIVTGNVNHIDSIGCNGDNHSQLGNILDGFDDWANLTFDFRRSPDFEDGIHTSTLTVDEITVGQIIAYANELDVDEDGIPHLLDNCPFQPNPDQTDLDGDIIGDVCDPTPPGEEASASPPEVDAGPSLDGVDEGSTLILDASSTDPEGDSLSFIWSSDSEANVQFNDPTVEDPTVTFLNNGVYTLRLEAIDSTGLSSIDTMTVTVTNVAPEIEEVSDTSIATTALAQFVSFADPGTDAWTIEVDYGDETRPETPTYGARPRGPAGVYVFPLEHTYEEAGRYLITITISDGIDSDEWDFVVTINRPDLLVLEHSRDGSTQIPAIAFTIANQGAGDAGEFTVLVECFPLDDVAPTRTTTFEIGDLAADNTIDIRSDPSENGCFSSVYSITVDVEDAIDETNEDNNVVFSETFDG